MEKRNPEDALFEDSDHGGVGEVLNASGHKQELERHFSLLSICSIGITTGNVWAALGGSIVCLAISVVLPIPRSTASSEMAMLIAINRSLHYTMAAHLVSYTRSSQYHACTL
jgi:hypothetical protein